MVAPNRNDSSLPQIILFDKSSSVRYTAGKVLERRYRVEGFGGIEEAGRRLERQGAGLFILGLDRPYTDYVPFLKEVRRRCPCLPVLFLLSRESGVEIDLPLSGILKKPFFPDDLREKVEGLLSRGRAEAERGFIPALSSPMGEKIRKWLGSRRVTEGIKEQVLRLCSLPLPVLVEGEEGTGKRWVIRALHHLGSWRESAFVSLSGRGLSREGFWQEVKTKIGDRSFSRGLDIYIDEVETLTWDMQGYLMSQAEEEWRGEDPGFAFGGPVRVLGASGDDLRRLARSGEIRREFAEMFWGVRLTLKPLRERAEEIAEMVGEIWRERGIGKRASTGALAELKEYEWPGNVEELEGLAVRTGILVAEEEIGSGEWKWVFEEAEKRKEEKGQEKIEAGGEREKEEKRSVGESIKGEGEGEKGSAGAEALLSTLVHEVKNPLVAISTFAHLLPERYEEEEFRGEFSRLVGLEVKRLNGVLEMLLEYGQLGAPRPAQVDLANWVRSYVTEKSPSILADITVDLENSPNPVRIDKLHLNFVFERVFERVQSQGGAGERVRIFSRGLTEGENRENLFFEFEERGVFLKPSPREIPFANDLDDEGLSLGLGLARRIMRKNDGEMSLIREEGGKTQILLRFRGRDSSQAEF